MRDFNVLPLEHDPPRPTQFAHCPQERTLGVPAIDREGVAAAGAVAAAHPDPQPQRRRAFLFAGTNRFDLHQDAEVGPGAVGKHGPVRRLGDGVFVAGGLGFLD